MPTLSGDAHSPMRIQRRRTRGWRKPPGAIMVSRPGRWGNPFAVDDTRLDGRHVAVEAYAAHLAAAHRGDPQFLPMLRAELAGHDLCCWCRLDVPCHADVLLRIANDQEPWMPELERSIPRLNRTDDTPPPPPTASRRRRAPWWQDRTPLPGQLAIDGTVVGSTAANDPGAR